MAFNEWLQAELESRGWTQGDLSRKTGASSSLVSYWLQGKRRPQRHYCEDIAAALDLPVQIVLQAAGRDVRQSNIPKGVDLHDPLIDFFGQNLDKLSPEDREELMRFGLKLLEERGEL